MNNLTLKQGDSLKLLKNIESNSIDLLCTDPPYAINFMGKNWDKALPPIDIFKERLRVLKPGRTPQGFPKDIIWDNQLRKNLLLGLHVDRIGTCLIKK